MGIYNAILKKVNEQSEFIKVSIYVMIGFFNHFSWIWSRPDDWYGSFLGWI